MQRRGRELSRRELLLRAGGGLGSVALALTAEAPAHAVPLRPHFPPRVKRIIHLFMNGGPFQADFFDPKPAINQYAGQRPAEVQFRTENATGGLLPVPFEYTRHGRSGLPISSVLPRTAEFADDLCVLRSLHTNNPNHGPALFMMNNGSITPTRPSLGSWLLYGLGSESENLPGYVVLCPGRPVRFAELWTSSFLPGEYQGTYLNHSNLDPRQMIPFLKPRSSDPQVQERQLALLRALEETGEADPVVEARLKAMETAFRMQFAASDAIDLSREPAAVREAYGSGHFAHGCLIARRLAERGVRMTQVYYGNGQPWDTHSNHTESVRKLAADIDQPIAALLGDLKQRGLLEDTLVVWGGEFGRTPTTEGSNGRDHNHYGFSMWLAGAGVKGGMAYGATDDFGFRAVQDRIHIHDLHATLLHLMGLDHTRLTYRYASRDFRLTDVAGEIVRPILV